MATRPHDPGLPPVPRFRRGTVTYPVRRPDGRVVAVSVPTDWPDTIRHAGRTYRATGNEGYRVADRVQAAEYADRHGHRVWLTADGAVEEE